MASGAETGGTGSSPMLLYIPAISSIVGSISVFKRKYIKPYLHPHIMQHVYIGCGRFMHIYASILASLCPKQTYMLIIGM